MSWNMPAGEPRIPIGLDPQGHKVDIDEAQERSRYYRCPECDEFLQVRHGEQRIWHYAHVNAEKDSPVCTLRTEAGIIEKYRKSPVEKKEAARQLRIGLLVHPYSDELRLVALLPTPSWDELSAVGVLSDVLNSVRVDGEGLANPPAPQSFHPGKPEVLIALKADSPTYSITITSTPAIPSIDGTWSSPLLRETDIFVGDWRRAERADPGTHVGEGDVIFWSKDPFEVSGLEPSKTYTLGKHQIFAVELTKDLLRLAQSAFPTLESSRSMFEMDVVLPAAADPRGNEPIQGMAGSVGLVAIIPPPNVNPGFEVVSVPFDAGKPVELARVGDGVPRVYRPSFPQRGTRRVSIHWGDRHRLLVLNSTSAIAQPEQRSWRFDKAVGIRVISADGVEKLLVPWQQSEPQDLGIVPGRPRPKTELAAPPGFAVGLKGSFPKNRKSAHAAVEPRVTEEEFPRLLDDWIEGGCTDVEVRFGAMGTIQLEVAAKLPRRPEPSRLTDEELRRRIGILGILTPERVTWDLIRRILEVDPKVAYKHHSIRGVTSRKQVRRVMREMAEHDVP